MRLSLDMGLGSIATLGTGVGAFMLSLNGQRITFNSQPITMRAS